MNLLTATGEASQFLGKADVEIKVGNDTFKHEILLAEIKDTAILEMDFLSSYGIDVLFSKSCLKVKSETIPCFTRKGDVKCSIISVVETVEIPPESEMIIKGRAVGPISYDSVGIVESTEHFVEKTGLLRAKAVVQQESNCIPLRLANFSTEPVVVHRHTIAATIESDRIDEKKHVRMVGATSGSPEGVIPDHLTEVYDKGCKQLGDFQKEKLKDVFSKSSADIGYTDLVKHKINIITLYKKSTISITCVLLKVGHLSK